MIDDPSSFASYLLLKRLASGGSVESYLAKSTDGTSQTRVLLRRVASADLADAAARRAFFAEAELRAALQHRNVARIFAHGERDGWCYTVSEHVEGTTLQKLLRRVHDVDSHVPIELAVEIGAQICAGLAAALAHTPSVIHRDLAPPAVLLGLRDEVKLTDFGSQDSSRVQVGTSGGTVLRRFVYQAPEQLRSKPIDGRSLVFSVGVCLYEMFSGKNPFVRDTPMLAIDAVTKFAPPPIGTTLPGYQLLDSILAKAMAKEPSARYRGPEELGQILDQLLERTRDTGGKLHLGTYVSSIEHERAGESSEWRTSRTVTTPGAVGEATQVTALSTLDGVADGVADDAATGETSSGATIIAPRPLAAPPSSPRWRARYAASFVAALALTLVVGRAVPRAGRDEPTTRATVAPPLAPPMTPPVTPTPVIATPVTAVPVTPTVTPTVVPLEAQHAEPLDAADTPSPGEAAPAGRGGEPAPSKKAARPTTAQATHGTLQLITLPTLPVFVGAKRAGKTVPLVTTSGKLTIGSQRHDFVVRLSYRLDGKRLMLQLDSTPWAMVQDGKGMTLGRTPIEREFSSDRAERGLRIVNPVEQREINVSVIYTPPDG